MDLDIHAAADICQVLHKALFDKNLISSDYIRSIYFHLTKLLALKCLCGFPECGYPLEQSWHRLLQRGLVKLAVPIVLLCNLE